MHKVYESRVMCCGGVCGVPIICLHCIFLQLFVLILKRNVWNICIYFLWNICIKPHSKFFRWGNRGMNLGLSNVLQTAVPSYVATWCQPWSRWPSPHFWAWLCRCWSFFTARPFCTHRSSLIPSSDPSSTAWELPTSVLCQYLILRIVVLECMGALTFTVQYFY